jgi:hypothetical protein
MTLEMVHSAYENGVLTITTDHFSYWAIGHVITDDDPGQNMDNNSEEVIIAFAIVIICLLCFVLLRLKR